MATLPLLSSGATSFSSSAAAAAAAAAAGTNKVKVKATRAPFCFCFGSSSLLSSAVLLPCRPRQNIRRLCAANKNGNNVRAICFSFPRFALIVPRNQTYRFRDVTREVFEQHVSAQVEEPLDVSRPALALLPVDHLPANVQRRAVLQHLGAPNGVAVAAVHISVGATQIGEGRQRFVVGVAGCAGRHVQELPTAAGRAGRFKIGQRDKQTIQTVRRAVVVLGRCMNYSRNAN